MSDSLSERLSYHIQLLQHVQQRLTRAAANSDPADPGAAIIAPEILHQINEVIEQLMQRTDSAYMDGQDWLMNILTHHPQLTPAVDRDLLWFFGGECLHFMSDDEIDLFQKLDEQEAEHDPANGPFDRAAVKTLLQQSSDQFNA